MTIILVCILIFAAILASGLFGLFVQHRLPEAQKSESARVVISQISGVLSLLLSLVLGTLVGTSFAFQTTQKTELDALDQAIHHAVIDLNRERIPNPLAKPRISA